MSHLENVSNGLLYLCTKFVHPSTSLYTTREQNYFTSIFFNIAMVDSISAAPANILIIKLSEDISPLKNSISSCKLLSRRPLPFRCCVPILYAFSLISKSSSKTNLLKAEKIRALLLNLLFKLLY